MSRFLVNDVSYITCNIKKFITRVVHVTSCDNFFYQTLFLQILEEEQFKCIEKIKTIGYTYMAASGLTNDRESLKDMNHVVALTDFAFAIQEQLKSVNQHSFNNFKMRIGMYLLSFKALFYIICSTNYCRTTSSVSRQPACHTEVLGSSPKPVSFFTPRTCCLL